MAIGVRLYSERRNNNSTRQLTGNVDYFARFDCELNAACSLLNPTLILNPETAPAEFTHNGSAASGSPFDVEHIGHWKTAYIHEFAQRWYHVVDITYNNGLWYMSLSVDVLPTYKSEIGASRQRIARSSKLVDPYLVDGYMPITSRGTTTELSLDFGSMFRKITSSSVFYYVLMVVNNSPTSPRGMITPYVLSYAQLQQFRAFLLSEPTEYTGPVTDVTKDMLKVLFNPMQYIIGCKAYHFQPNIETESAGSEVRLGYWKTGIKSVGVCAGNTQEFSDEIALPHHPDYDHNRKYLDTTPYTTVRMELQPFYSGELDSTYFYNNRKLKVTITVDCVSGDAELTLASIPPDKTDYVTFAVYYASIALDIPLSQIMANNYAGDVADYVSNLDNTMISNAINSATIQHGRIQNRRWATSKSAPWKAVSGLGLSSLSSLDTITRYPLQDISTNLAMMEYDAEDALIDANFSTTSAALSIQSQQHQLSAAAARMPIASIRGTVATVAKMNTPKKIYVDYWRQPDVDESQHGRACAQYATISDIPGYIECVNPRISCGTVTEQSEVLQYMATGFYYE